MSGPFPDSAESDPAQWRFLLAKTGLSRAENRSVVIREWHYTELKGTGAVVELADTRVLEALARKSVPVRPRAAPPHRTAALGACYRVQPHMDVLF